MIGYVLARRYARAMVDLAMEADLLSEAGSDLERISELFSRTPELVNLFSDPTVPVDMKEKVLGDILEAGGVHELTMRFLGILLRRNRILGIHRIAEAYRDIEDGIRNRVRAKVVTATPLDEDQKERIRKSLAGLSGKDVILETEVDGGLLGGAVTYMGSRVFDGSLKGQLDHIRERLSKGR